MRIHRIKQKAAFDALIKSGLFVVRNHVRLIVHDFFFAIVSIQFIAGRKRKGNSESQNQGNQEEGAGQSKAFTAAMLEQKNAAGNQKQHRSSAKEEGSESF